MANGKLSIFTLKVAGFSAPYDYNRIDNRYRRRSDKMRPVCAFLRGFRQADFADRFQMTTFENAAQCRLVFPNKIEEKEERKPMGQGTDF